MLIVIAVLLGKTTSRPSSTWIVMLVNSINFQLISLGQSEEFEWMASSLTALAQQHPDHLLSLLSGLSVLPQLIGIATERADADRLLETAIQTRD